MQKRIILSAILLLGAICASARHVTIEQCVDSAQANYPIIRKYELMRSTSALSLDEINTAWLPRVALTAQGTWQNAVPTFPGNFTDLMSKFGTTLSGIPRIQYRAGIEVSQTVWDGGATARRRDVERSATAVSEAGVQIDMYAVRERVENLYFALLLIRDQIEQSRLTQQLLEGNLARVRSLVKEGAALQADADMIEAQVLTLSQQIVQAETAAEGYAAVLSLFTGMKIGVGDLTHPTATLPTDLTPLRPELLAIASRQKLNIATQRANDTSWMPKLGLFAQGFYGNPGLDNFKSMVDRTGSFNLIGGVKGTWTLDALYTRRSSRQRTALANAILDAERDAMLRNIAMQTTSQLSAIEGIRKAAASDERIVALRTNVRRAAEAQLREGVIDTTSLLAKITDENLASLSAKYRQIQLLQEIYKLKYTLNR